VRGGSVSRHKSARVSYLPQSGIEHRERSLYEELETAFSHFLEDERRLEEIGRQLENRSRDDGTTRALLEEHHLISERIVSSHYYQREQYIGEVLSGLGFAPATNGAPAMSFPAGGRCASPWRRFCLNAPT
jgi:ATP-binding cassette subfamily F protein 3